MGERSPASWFLSSRGEGPRASSAGPTSRSEGPSSSGEADATRFRNPHAASLDLRLEVQAVAPRRLGNVASRPGLRSAGSWGPEGGAGPGQALAPVSPAGLRPSVPRPAPPFTPPRTTFPGPHCFVLCHSSPEALAPPGHLLSVTATRCLLPAPHSSYGNTSPVPASRPRGPYPLPSLPGSLFIFY